MTFVGRKRELGQLRTLRRGRENRIAVVYGRRRIGKTTLVREAWADLLGTRRWLQFEGLEAKPKRQQLANFVEQLLRQRPGLKPPAQAPTEWRHAFRMLADACADGDVVIVLDELQWMANYRRELVSELKMAWEQYMPQDARLTLVLAGSVASFMVKKVIKSSALYGRVRQSLHLEPFLLRDAAALMPEHGFDEVLLAYLLVGGVPLYLKLLGEAPSVVLGMDELGFRRDGFLRDEYAHIFTSHFGRNRHYERIVALLARRSAGLTRDEIAKALNISRGGGLSDLLYDLDVAGLIHRWVPFNRAAGSKLARYIVSDPYVRLFHRLLEQYRNDVDEGREAIFASLQHETPFLSYLGSVFELVALGHRRLIAERLGFGAVRYDVGPFYAPDVQADLVYRRADRVITLVEAKYKRGPIGTEVADEVARKIERLPNRPGYTVQPVLLTASALSKELRQRHYFRAVIHARELAMQMDSVS